VPLSLMFAFAVWLLGSVLVNAFRFGAHWSDVFAILRLFYFSAVMVFCVAYVRRFGLRPLLMAFIAGVAALTAGRILDATSNMAPRVTEMPLLQDPNVIGNMLGVAVLMSSMLIFVGSSAPAMTFTAGLSVASAMTFSKGTWFMVLAGLAANVLALVMRPPRTVAARKRMVAAIAVFLFAVVVFVALNLDLVAQVITLKVRSTVEDHSVGLRFRYALGGAYAMIDNPIFGVGYRNYYVVERMYPQLSLPPSDNAHNVYAQIAAIGGVPALLMFMLLFVYPFVQLWSVVRREGPAAIAAPYVASAVLVFFLSGAVQLQIIAQPFFWVYTGLVKGWRCNSSS
jgi:O-antigen ligase